MSDVECVDWSKKLFDGFVEAGITLFPYVPDAGNKRLIEFAEEHIGVRPILLTTEEEGVAICAGADLAHQRAVVCMQSSGVGNIPNFLSFVNGGRFPILMMISMRGDYGEQNPWQYPMGQAVAPILNAPSVNTSPVKTKPAHDAEPTNLHTNGGCFDMALRIGIPNLYNGCWCNAKGSSLCVKRLGWRTCHITRPSLHNPPLGVGTCRGEARMLGISPCQLFRRCANRSMRRGPKSSLMMRRASSKRSALVRGLEVLLRLESSLGAASPRSPRPSCGSSSSSARSSGTSPRSPALEAAGPPAVVSAMGICITEIEGNQFPPPSLHQAVDRFHTPYEQPAAAFFNAATGSLPLPMLNPRPFNTVASDCQ